MLSVVIQPKNYKHMSALKDIKSVSVMKFGRNALVEDDFYYDVLYDGELTDEAIEVITRNLNGGNVITYSGNLLIRMLDILKEEKGLQFDKDKIIGLMEDYASIYPTSKKWHKLQEALENYGYDTYFDRDDPCEITKHSIILYRFMKEDPKCNTLKY